MKTLKEGDGILAGTREVEAIAFAPDGKLLAADGSGTLDVWEVATGNRKKAFPGYKTHIVALAFSPDGRWLASGTLGGSVSVRTICRER
jgi:WD40 repeat protein